MSIDIMRGGSVKRGTIYHEVWSEDLGCAIEVQISYQGDAEVIEWDIVSLIDRDAYRDWSPEGKRTLLAWAQLLCEQPWRA